MLTQVEQKMLMFLRKGNIIIYPTNTLYGIGCDAFNKKAVEKIFKIKKRSLDNPVSLLYAGIETVKKTFYTENIKIYTGPYTMLLRPRKKMPDYFIKHGLCGVRISNNWLSRIIKEFGNPIVTTSANISASKVMPVDIGSISEKIIQQCNAFIYDGPTKYKKPSTIINPYTGEVIR